LTSPRRAFNDSPAAARTSVRINAHSPSQEARLIFIRKAKTAKRQVEDPNGRTWEAEICLHAGTDPQAPRLMVIFRDPTRTRTDRYTLLPPDAPKVAGEAARELDDETFRRLLMRSVPLRAFKA
jgi:hypothetical protein